MTNLNLSNRVNPRRVTSDLGSLIQYPSFIGFDSMFKDLTDAINSKSNNYPPCNVIKVNDSRYVIEMAIAGFSQNEIDVELRDRTLFITGAKLEETGPDAEYTYIQRGISTRAFTRTFTLAEGVEITSATVKDGILRIVGEREIPEEPKSKKIEIKFDN